MIKLPFLTKNINWKIKPVILIIMDGFGVAHPSEGNAVTLAKTPNIDYFQKNYPHTELIASGESVGLPANEVGNTEVGHLTIGAGRVILQDLKRINLAIQRGTFFDNKAFLQVASHVKLNKSKLHIMGLIGSGHVHSSVEHMFALLQFCRKEGVDRVYLHLFTDGRDSPPTEGAEIIEKIEERLKEIRIGKIASVSGRYYAMDRDKRWSRTERAYKAIVNGEGLQANSAVEAARQSYAKNQTDEFIEPTVVISQGKPMATVDDNDGVIFYNFRVDRPKQLTMAFVLTDFEKIKSFDFGYDEEASKRIGEVKMEGVFTRNKIPKNLFFVTMTEYQKNLPVSSVAFGPEIVEKPLPEILSKSGKKQMHMAESEKERFVRYYFDGMREDALPGEDYLIIPSPKVATYDLKPEMSLPKLVAECKKQIEKDIYHFIIINFANPDMVAHSGNLKASIKTVEYTDKYLWDLVNCILSHDGTAFVTADHGNVEELLTFPTTTYFFTSQKGTVNTDHSNNPVPLIIINNYFKGKNVRLNSGALSDIAPTILSYMGIEKPEEMTGRDLLEEFRKNLSGIANNQKKI